MVLVYGQGSRFGKVVMVIGGQNPDLNPNPARVFLGMASWNEVEVASNLLTIPVEQAIPDRLLSSRAYFRFACWCKVRGYFGP
jgi:hypothetical protein